jgi:restriction system protein
MFLHLVARESSTPVHAAGLADLGTVYSHTLFGVMAYLLQFLIPPALLSGAALSAWRGSRARQWIEDSVQDPAVVTALTGAQFEQLVAEFFRRQEFNATEQIVGGADGGVDVVLTRGAERFLVQCKHWRTQAVGAPVVRELKGVVAAQRATGGYVVTSGTFTPQARAFAAEAGISLIDGAALRSLSGSRPPLSSVVSAAQASVRAAIHSSPASPSCPRCGGPMQRRTASRGQHAGNDFWGCTGFPKCRGILSI